MILGRRDPSLSELGREQAARLAGSAARVGVTAIWTSPMCRARETAAIVAAAVGVRPQLLDDLIESDRGDWEGQTLEHIAAAYPELYASFEAADPEFAFPGGGSLADQVRRTVRALDVIAARSAPALVVAHVGTIRAAMLATGLKPPPERDVAHAEIVRLIWTRAATA